MTHGSDTTSCLEIYHKVKKTKSPVPNISNSGEGFLYCKNVCLEYMETDYIPQRDWKLEYRGLFRLLCMYRNKILKVTFNILVVGGWKCYLWKNFSHIVSN